ncbi:hypothetical protein FHX82_004956 [Amycolatopsis bartoniae]|uniref:hypothetical protein n=1 Tax=Amycolatopsis bartoniae TaxID=941986 RepID=UPI0016059EFB|nr:hypothetical protein [Amycolatopsis bartoniae]MBB2937880.1 hypothetical protein [Amycolatopsis bartoniae]
MSRLAFGCGPLGEVARQTALATLETAWNGGIRHFDTVLVHDPDDHLTLAVRETFPALERLRAGGVVGEIGVGTTCSRRRRSTPGSSRPAAPTSTAGRRRRSSTSCMRSARCAATAGQNLALCANRCPRSCGRRWRNYCRDTKSSNTSSAFGEDHIAEGG